MNNLDEILTALGFSEEYIKELSEVQKAENFEAEYISFENDIEDEGVYSSNTAIVEAYVD